MAEQQEQNRTEDATPFKLKRARERGMVARSAELGFLGGLLGLTAFVMIAGSTMVATLAQMMRRAIVTGIDSASEPEQIASLVGAVYQAAFHPLVIFGGTAVLIVLILEIIQLRGLIFSLHPLKFDFSRLNPATGMKRLFSMRMLKETLKTLLKSMVYFGALWLLIRDSALQFSIIASDGDRIPEALQAAGMRLIYTFIAISFGFVVIDQILVRGEFRKQMRMSRREVTRETKDREGDPRIRAKRKQLHADFVRQSKASGELPGSDMLLVNPEHYAVALRYDTDRMQAPMVTAKGRNRFALTLRAEANRFGIPILYDPPLARALYRETRSGREIPEARYEAVAAHYVALRRRPSGADRSTVQANHIKGLEIDPRGNLADGEN